MSKTDEDIEDLPLDSDKAPTTATTTETGTDEGATTIRTGTDGEEETEIIDDDEEEEAEEEEPEVYISEDFISGPCWPKTSTIPTNILIFE